MSNECLLLLLTFSIYRVRDPSQEKPHPQEDSSPTLTEAIKITPIKSGMVVRTLTNQHSGDRGKLIPEF